MHFSLFVFFFFSFFDFYYFYSSMPLNMYTELTHRLQVLSPQRATCHLSIWIMQDHATYNNNVGHSFYSSLHDISYQCWCISYQSLLIHQKITLSSFSSQGFTASTILRVCLVFFPLVI